MEKVIIYVPGVEQYLEDLVDILFYEEYFGFEDAAQSYAEKIVHLSNKTFKISQQEKHQTN